MLLLWDRTLRATGYGRVVKVGSISQRCKLVIQSCDFFVELFDFRGIGVGIGDSRNSRCGYLLNLVCRVSQFVELHGGVRGGENHPDVER